MKIREGENRGEMGRSFVATVINRMATLQYDGIGNLL